MPCSSNDNSSESDMNRKKLNCTLFGSLVGAVLVFFFLGLAGYIFFDSNPLEGLDFGVGYVSGMIAFYFCIRSA